MRTQLFCFILLLSGNFLNTSYAGETGTGAKPPAPAAALLTKDEAKEVEAVITSMLAAGFPDAAKAEVHLGTLSVKAMFDPAKDLPPLPSSASKMQMTNPDSTVMTYRYEFNGLHFKLADGSWVIALMYRFKSRAGDQVNVDNAPVVNVAELTAIATAAHPFNAEKDAAKYLEAVTATQRPRAAAEMNRIAPVTRYLKLNPDSLAPAIVLLHRAGWSDALTASLAVADQRARYFWQLRPWTEPAAVFDPTGAYPNSKDEEAAWKKAHPQFTSEAPQTALRRALFRWCRGQMMVENPEDAMLSLNVAAAASKAAIDPKDPQGNAARVDALLAGAKLPVTPAEKADLASRLQSWEARPRMPRMVVSGGNDGNAKNGSISMTTGFEAPTAAYVPDKKDLDALVALLGDERPSRFWDYNGPRTLGENAWRAVAALLNADPRTLAAQPTDKPWTVAERKAEAAAFQRWWKDHRKEYVEK